MIAILEEIFLATCKVCDFQVKLLSIFSPGNLYSLVNSTASLSISTFSERSVIFCLDPISIELDFAALTTSVLYFNQERVSLIQVCNSDSTSLKKKQIHKGLYHLDVVPFSLTT